MERKDKKSFKRHICCFNSFSVFLDLISILFSCFNFHSILYRFNDLLNRLNDIISQLNEIFFVSFPLFSRIKGKLVKSFVQLKDLDIST